MFAEIANQVAGLNQSEERGSYRSRPSMAGPERCLRSMVYAAMGYKPAPFPGRAILSMGDSSFHETITADQISQTVLQVHSSQLPVNLEVPMLNPKGFYCSVCSIQVAPYILHGHIDGIITDPLLRDWLWEHKAFTHFQFERLKKILPLDNLAQSALYARALKEEYKLDIDRILLTIKNKNTAQYMDFECTYLSEEDLLVVNKRVVSHGDAPAIVDILEHRIEEACKSSIEKFAYVEMWAAADYLPDRPYRFGTEYPCGWCAFGEGCWQGYVEELQVLSTDAELEEGAATAARFYKELSAQETEIKKQKEEVKEALLQMLDAADAKSGRAGDYIVERTFSERTEYIEELIPPSAIVTKHSERFNVKRIKPMEQPKPKRKKEGVGGVG